MVSPQQLHTACERAATYRRLIAVEAGHPPGNLRERIDIVPELCGTAAGNGWLRAGCVSDEVVGSVLTVWWHPATDRVKIEHPAPDGDRPPAPDAGPPIWWSAWIGEGYARPGYVYTFEGRDYTPAEAARIVTERRSEVGWTWRES